jgi:hypothetical protein
MMCPGVFLTVELAAHPAVLTIITRPALAIAKNLECRFSSLVERTVSRCTFDKRTHCFRQCSVQFRNFLRASRRH